MSFRNHLIQCGSKKCEKTTKRSRHKSNIIYKTNFMKNYVLICHIDFCGLSSNIILRTANLFWMQTEHAELHMHLKQNDISLL